MRGDIKTHKETDLYNRSNSPISEGRKNGKEKERGREEGEGQYSDCCVAGGICCSVTDRLSQLEVVTPYTWLHLPSLGEWSVIGSPGPCPSLLSG